MLTFDVPDGTRLAYHRKGSGAVDRLSAFRAVR